MFDFKKMSIFRVSYFKLITSILVIIFITIIIIGVFFHKKPFCEKCNVILVSIDTLSALHLPCYGYERNTAPNLCAYADKNITFLNSYSQSSTTKDSHFSIFTSLYPHTHKMTTVLEGILSEKYITLAQVLRLNNYQTIYNGQLFDIHFPLNEGMERGFNIFEGGNIDKWKYSYSRLLKNAEQKKQTFVFLHTYAVHAPYTTGHKDKHMFTNMPENPNIPLTQEEYEKITPEFLSFVVDFITKSYFVNKGKVGIVDGLKKAKSFEEAKEIFNNFAPGVKSLCFDYWYYSKINKNDPKQVEYAKALYDEQIFNMDKKLGDLFKLMDDPKLFNNTILIITADHGEEFMEHGSLAHSTNLYRSQTAVPLIFHIPGMGPRKINDLVEGIDIYPTILDLLGLKKQSKIEGIDLTGIIRGDKNAVKNTFVLSELGSMGGIQIKNGRLYFDLINKKPTEFYDLKSDILEKNNVLLKNQAIMKEFTKKINKF